jgi:hypothetical protein
MLPVCFVASFLLMCGATAKQINSVVVWTHCAGVLSGSAFNALVAAVLSAMSLLLWAVVARSNVQKYSDTRILAVLFLSILALPIGFAYWALSTPWTPQAADQLDACGLTGLALPLRAVPVVLPLVLLVATVFTARLDGLSRRRGLVILAAAPLAAGLVQIASIYLTA